MLCFSDWLPHQEFFYQMPEATAGLSSGSWGASAGLPGRFSDNGPYKGATSGTGPANRRLREARLSDKSREISVITHSEAGIPRVSNRHCGNEVFLARNKNTQTSESGREIYLRANFGKITSQFSWPVAGYSSSYNNCAIVFFEISRETFSKALNSSEGNQSCRIVVVLSLESRGELMWWKN